MPLMGNKLFYFAHRIDVSPLFPHLERIMPQQYQVRMLWGIYNIGSCCVWQATHKITLHFVRAVQLPVVLCGFKVKEGHSKTCGFFVISNKKLLSVILAFEVHTIVMKLVSKKSRGLGRGRGGWW